MIHHKMFALLLIAVTLGLSGSVASAGIVNTKHNLSATGPGTVKAPSESEVCIFCHTPHNSSPTVPLWNRNLPVLNYTPYSSSTMQSSPGQPTHASKLCLSCHDGTIALGSVLSRPTPISVSGSLSNKANLGTNLSDDHPVSFAYDSALAAKNTELVNPALLTGSVHLDSHGQLQCTTCHDPHSDTYSKFLVVDGSNGALCTKCHTKSGWTGSAHATSIATWNGMGTTPWPHTTWTTVAANGCENCHAPHAAGTAKELLNYSTEEGNCLPCHNGNVDRKNISNEVAKPYRHSSSAYFQVHDPVENFSMMARHVECQDCHNPHAAVAGTATAPNVSGPLTKVAGVTMAGTRTANSNYQYEVCLRCHADNANVPAPNIARVILQPNIRLKLQTTNPSFHPVLGPRNNTEVTSLISPWTSSSWVYCTDCHNNDSGPGAGGTGPRGPHGSTWRYLLERQYLTADNTTESVQAYALCYKCHDRAKILGDQTFRYHNKHIVGERAPCSACHDAHGISSTQGNATNNSNLINFDKTIVLKETSTQRLEFRDTGVRRGQCYLLCHGEAHNPYSY
ncbi:MAG: hypothetical protein HZB26_22760 [Candidatus Hydrogenedentes bacterium]|nr:hypothetical protein [Candidatus Hydrogenedentota bacterium]